MVRQAGVRLRAILFDYEHFAGTFACPGQTA